MLKPEKLHLHMRVSAASVIFIANMLHENTLLHSVIDMSTYRTANWSASVSYLLEKSNILSDRLVEIILESTVCKVELLLQEKSSTA